jgi:hypothetical protein
VRTGALIALCAAFSASQAGEVVLNVVSPANMAGSTAKVNTRIQSNGTKALTLSLSLKSANGTAVVVQELIFAADGRPIRMSRRTSLGTGKLVEFIRADIGASTIKVTVERDGKPVVNTVPLPKGELKNVSEFWILRDKPTVGQKHTYQKFDLTSLTFAPATVVYKGLQSVKVGGKTIKAHQIVEGTATTWLDDKGDPVKIEGRNSTMERRL